MLAIGSFYPKPDYTDPLSISKIIGLVAKIYVGGKYLHLACDAQLQGDRIAVGTSKLIERSDGGDKILARFDPWVMGEPLGVPTVCDVGLARGYFGDPLNFTFLMDGIETVDKFFDLVIERNEQWLAEQSEKALQEAVG